MKHRGMLREHVEHSGPGGKPQHSAAQIVPVFNITIAEDDAD
jgi:hypothetical protein